MSLLCRSDRSFVNLKADSLFRMLSRYTFTSLVVRATEDAEGSMGTVDSDVKEVLERTYRTSSSDSPAFSWTSSSTSEVAVPVGSMAMQNLK
jgi:hypothetical protein